MAELRSFLDQPLVVLFSGLIGLLLASAVVYYTTRRILLAAIRRAVAATTARWDDHLVEAGLFARAAHVPPALVIYYGLPVVRDLPPALLVLGQRVAIATVTVAVGLAVGAFLTAANRIYSERPENRSRPIKGYLQVLRIALYLVVGLLVLSVLVDRSPWIFLTGLGAMAAVLLLIFRDTILGLVASVQLTANDMVQVGDWIEMPQYGADGDVIDVALHTVKVQNWDKTITTIPTHKLIEESFRNWRGMQVAGGRRIKRAIFLDLSSIRFLEEEEIERFGHFALLKDYVAGKREELARWNAEGGRDARVNADIRRLTNAGTFRAYVQRYLERHPKVRHDMTLLVRQLAPGPTGLPLEVYCFAADTAWARYEAIQADIFDHLFAVLPDFGLRAFQSPSGADLAGLRGAL
jgi:miniconductance mechanosensitive channel